MKTTFKIFIILALTAFAVSCSITATVIIGEKNNASFVVDGFAECRGITFNLTLEQEGKTPVKSTGVIASSTIVFGTTFDFDISRIITVNLEVIGDRDCGPFKVGKRYKAEIVLEPQRDKATGQPVPNRFVIDVDDFREQ